MTTQKPAYTSPIWHLLSLLAACGTDPGGPPDFDLRALGRMVSFSY